MLKVNSDISFHCVYAFICVLKTVHINIERYDLSVLIGRQDQRM